MSLNYKDKTNNKSQDNQTCSSVSCHNKRKYRIKYTAKRNESKTRLNGKNNKQDYEFFKGPYYKKDNFSNKLVEKRNICLEPKNVHNNQNNYINHTKTNIIHANNHMNSIQVNNRLFGQNLSYGNNVYDQLNQCVPVPPTTVIDNRCDKTSNKTIIDVNQRNISFQNTTADSSKISLDNTNNYRHIRKPTFQPLIPPPIELFIPNKNNNSNNNKTNNYNINNYISPNFYSNRNIQQTYPSSNTSVPTAQSIDITNGKNIRVLREECYIPHNNNFKPLMSTNYSTNNVNEKYNQNVNQVSNNNAGYKQRNMTLYENIPTSLPTPPLINNTNGFTTNETYIPFFTDILLHNQNRIIKPIVNEKRNQNYAIYQNTEKNQHPVPNIPNSFLTPPLSNLNTNTYGVNESNENYQNILIDNNRENSNYYTNHSNIHPEITVADRVPIQYINHTNHSNKHSEITVADRVPIQYIDHSIYQNKITQPLYNNIYDSNKNILYNPSIPRAQSPNINNKKCYNSNNFLLYDKDAKSSSMLIKAFLDKRKKNIDHQITNNSEIEKKSQYKKKQIRKRKPPLSNKQIKTKNNNNINIEPSPPDISESVDIRIINGMLSNGNVIPTNNESSNLQNKNDNTMTNDKIIDIENINTENINFENNNIKKSKNFDVGFIENKNLSKCQTTSYLPNNNIFDIQSYKCIDKNVSLTTSNVLTINDKNNADESEFSQKKDSENSILPEQNKYEIKISLLNEDINKNVCILNQTCTNIIDDDNNINVNCKYLNNVDSKLSENGNVGSQNVDKPPKNNINSLISIQNSTYMLPQESSIVIKNFLDMPLLDYDNSMKTNIKKISNQILNKITMLENNIKEKDKSINDELENENIIIINDDSSSPKHKENESSDKFINFEINGLETNNEEIEGNTNSSEACKTSNTLNNNNEESYDTLNILNDNSALNNSTKKYFAICKVCKKVYKTKTIIKGQSCTKCDLKNKEVIVDDVDEKMEKCDDLQKNNSKNNSSSIISDSIQKEICTIYSDIKNIAMKKCIIQISKNDKDLADRKQIRCERCNKMINVTYMQKHNKTHKIRHRNKYNIEKKYQNYSTTKIKNFDAEIKVIEKSLMTGDEYNNYISNEKENCSDVSTKDNFKKIIETVNLLSDSSNDCNSCSIKETEIKSTDKTNSTKKSAFITPPKYTMKFIDLPTSKKIKEGYLTTKVKIFKTSIQSYHCTYCGKKFHTIVMLKMHEVECINVNFKNLACFNSCNKCKKFFDDNTALNNHKKTCI